MKTMVILIRNTAGVRCREVVRFSEGPLWEVRLYTHITTSISLDSLMSVYIHVLSAVIIFSCHPGQMNFELELLIHNLLPSV